MKTLLAFAILAASALAQSTMQTPQVGFAAIAGGEVRPVFGVAGNFILGPSVAGNARSEAFSGLVGILKTDSSLIAFDPKGNVLANAAAGPGLALFAFSSGGAALAYIPSTNSLFEWFGGRFATLSVRPDASDNMLAIAFRNEYEATLIVRRSNGIWEIQLPLGRNRAPSQKALTGVSAPVLALASGQLLFTDANGIVVRNPDNSEVHIPAHLPARSSLQQMNADWVQLADTTSARRFAIRITPGRQAVYQLPEGAQ
jgi:hypothetical protein